MNEYVKPAVGTGAMTVVSAGLSVRAALTVRRKCPECNGDKCDKCDNTGKMEVPHGLLQKDQ